jgi:hypothetical protein
MVVSELATNKNVQDDKLHKLSVKLSMVLKLCVGECKWVVG